MVHWGYNWDLLSAERSQETLNVPLHSLQEEYLAAVKLSRCHKRAYVWEKAGDLLGVFEEKKKSQKQKQNSIINADNTKIVFIVFYGNVFMDCILS